MDQVSRALLTTAGGEDKLYVEDVFSTYTYEGTGAARSVTNGINLAGSGGLVWIKQNQQTGGNVGHCLATPTRLLSTSGNQSSGYWPSINPGVANNGSSGVTFNSDGFSLGTDTAHAFNNFNTGGGSDNYVSWSFREQRKFFDIVEYTGNGANRTIAHGLGSAPGFIIIKCTSVDSDWLVYHRSLVATQALKLNVASGAQAATTVWNSTAPTDTVFSLGTSTEVNQSGATYVAFLFAHDAGGFGDSGAENVITCGTYQSDAALYDAELEEFYTPPKTVSIGFEPQWLLIKGINGAGAGSNWRIFDQMNESMKRGSRANLQVNIESGKTDVSATSSGFRVGRNPDLNFTESPPNTGGDNYIYVAIRRGLMRRPTNGTSVFAPIAYNVPTGTSITVGFPVDFLFHKWRTGVQGNLALTRHLTFEVTDRTDAATLPTPISLLSDLNNTRFRVQAAYANVPVITHSFRRARGFFDVVQYWPNGTAQAVAHDLGVVPEMIITKRIDSTTNGSWYVYHKLYGTSSNLTLNSAGAQSDLALFWDVAPTASVFTPNDFAFANGGQYLAYLFASCPGVSMVGSYTGNGTSQTINCGFTNGARYVAIKRGDNAGEWYIFDTARGIIAGDDPFIAFNKQDAEVTNHDPIDPTNSGFVVNQSLTSNINVNAATYIFLAIA
jgi:hypothetical protein